MAPPIVVGSDDNNSSGETIVDELPVEESDDLSSLSVLVSLLLISIIAVSRR